MMVRTKRSLSAYVGLLAVSIFMLMGALAPVAAQSRISSTLDGRTITIVGGSNFSTNFSGTRGEAEVDGFSFVIEGDTLTYGDQSFDIGSEGEVELVVEGDRVSLRVAGTEIATIERDLAETIEQLRRDAEAGDPVAQNNLGVRYIRGDGVERDVAEAARWYRMAAEQGSATAQSNLGYLLAFDDEYDNDPVEAAEWFRRAADQGHISALVDLGVIYYRGLGMEPDRAHAAELFHEAAEAGHRAAQHNLGVMYRDGDGVNEDWDEAERWFALSAEQGYEDAISALETLRSRMAERTDIAQNEDEPFPPPLPPRPEPEPEPEPGNDDANDGPPPLPRTDGPPPLPPVTPALPPYYAGIDGQQVGPLDEAELRARIAAGEITETTLVWTTGMAEWTPAGEVADVAALLDDDPIRPEPDTPEPDRPEPDTPEPDAPPAFDGTAYLLTTWRAEGESMVEGVGMAPLTATVVYAPDGTYTFEGVLDVEVAALGPGQRVAFLMSGSGTWAVQSSTPERIIMRRSGSLTISADDLGFTDESSEDGLQFIAIIDQDSHRDSEGLVWRRVQN